MNHKLQIIWIEAIMAYNTDQSFAWRYGEKQRKKNSLKNLDDVNNL
jgi:hypothetical protein